MGLGLRRMVGVSRTDVCRGSIVSGIEVVGATRRGGSMGTIVSRLSGRGLS